MRNQNHTKLQDVLFIIASSVLLGSLVSWSVVDWLLGPRVEKTIPYKACAQTEVSRPIGEPDYEEHFISASEMFCAGTELEIMEPINYESFDWDAEEDNMLVKIAMAEAEGEGLEGKALVIRVVLNRVYSDKFPDSIEDVISQPKQFSVYKEGGRYWTTTPDEECYEALTLIKTGWDESDGALYFERARKTSTWHSRNLTYLFQEGHHNFYK